MIKSRNRFTQKEFTDRQNKVRNKLIQCNIDSLIVTDPANIYWLTGYDAWSFYVHQCVVISATDLFWFGRGIDAFGASLTTYLTDECIVSYSDDYVMSANKHPMEVLAKTLCERGLNLKQIGIEKDNYYFSARAAETLYSNLPNSNFVDTTNLVNWQRAIKSKQEIIYMQRAAKIIAKVYEKILEIAEPGIQKNHLVAEILRTNVKGVDQHYGDYTSIVPLIGTGVESAACHMTWDGTKINNDSITFLELASAYARYHTPCSRTLCFGKVSQKYLDAEKVILEAIEIVLEKFKEGNTCADVSNAFTKILTQYGFEKNNRCGYPIGASYPPDWGERTMSLRQNDNTILKENMTFHFMPALWFEDGVDSWGFEITESVQVTKAGGKCLTNVPRKLFIK